jgi:hypothetical protein
MPKMQLNFKKKKFALAIKPHNNICAAELWIFFYTKT